ncbi:trypco2 family protein [Streptomyces sp. NPDC059037]|uniref:trypco2 family protein n=1 Tax=Streptomyces sp. NPDC059037 TaxID=3346710 RepID=UPI00368E5D61
MADNEAWAGLAEAIGAIRGELQRAADEGRGQGVQFRTGPVELEFSVDVRVDGEARAKVFVLPFSAEAKAARAKGTVSRVKLTLQPVDPQTGEDARVGDESAEERPE